MNDIIMWIIIGIVGAIALGVLVWFIVKLCKMDKDARKKLILTFLIGACDMAEKEIGKGNGAAKLKEVEDYFNQHASWFMKIILSTLGKNTLKDLIEEALKQAKSAFEKQNDNNK